MYLLLLRHMQTCHLQSVNFHTLFAALHQHEASAKQRMLKQTREKTHRDLNLGGALQQAATPKRAGSAATMRPASRARSEWVD